MDEIAAISITGLAARVKEKAEAYKQANTAVKAASDVLDSARRVRSLAQSELEQAQQMLLSDAVGDAAVPITEWVP